MSEKGMGGTYSHDQGLGNDMNGTKNDKQPNSMTASSDQPNAQHIHIVEDDDKVAELLSGQLDRFGYEVTRAKDWQNVAGEVSHLRPDLIVLDINLPYYDGFHWCRRIRQFTKAPIIFVSARDGGMDQVMALESGGDDYVTKPFHPEVVVAKVSALLRRTYGDYALTLPENGTPPGNLGSQSPSQSAGDELSIGRLSLDLKRATMTVGDSTDSLTRTELALLGALIEAQGAVVKRETLLELLWDDTQFVDDNTLTVNVTRVRRKLADLGVPDAVLTVRGVGYRINNEILEAPA